MTTSVMDYRHHVHSSKDQNHCCHNFQEQEAPASPATCTTASSSKMSDFAMDHEPPQLPHSHSHHGRRHKKDEQQQIATNADTVERFHRTSSSLQREREAWATEKESFEEQLQRYKEEIVLLRCTTQRAVEDKEEALGKLKQLRNLIKGQREAREHMEEEQHQSLIAHIHGQTEEADGGKVIRRQRRSSVSDKIKSFFTGGIGPKIDNLSMHDNTAAIGDAEEEPGRETPQTKSKSALLQQTQKISAPSSTIQIKKEECPPGTKEDSSNAATVERIRSKAKMHSSTAAINQTPSAAKSQPLTQQTWHGAGSTSAGGSYYRNKQQNEELRVLFERQYDHRKPSVSTSEETDKSESSHRATVNNKLPASAGDGVGAHVLPCLVSKRRQHRRGASSPPEEINNAETAWLHSMSLREISKQEQVVSTSSSYATVVETIEKNLSSRHEQMTGLRSRRRREHKKLLGTTTWHGGDGRISGHADRHRINALLKSLEQDDQASTDNDREGGNQHTPRTSVSLEKVDEQNDPPSNRESVVLANETCNTLALSPKMSTASKKKRAAIIQANRETFPLPKEKEDVKVGVKTKNLRGNAAPFDVPSSSLLSSKKKQSSIMRSTKSHKQKNGLSQTWHGGGKAGRKQNQDLSALFDSFKAEVEQCEQQQQAPIKDRITTSLREQQELDVTTRTCSKKTICKKEDNSDDDGEGSYFMPWDNKSQRSPVSMNVMMDGEGIVATTHISSSGRSGGNSGAVASGPTREDVDDGMAKIISAITAESMEDLNRSDNQRMMLEREQSSRSLQMTSSNSSSKKTNSTSLAAMFHQSATTTPSLRGDDSSSASSHGQHRLSTRRGLNTAASSRQLKNKTQSIGLSASLHGSNVHRNSLQKGSSKKMSTSNSTISSGISASMHGSSTRSSNSACRDGLDQRKHAVLSRSELEHILTESPAGVEYSPSQTSKQHNLMKRVLCKTPTKRNNNSPAA
jgi:hypothetical protein